MAQYEVVHGQIRPSHIMVDRRARFRLVDCDCTFSREDVAAGTTASVQLPNAYQHLDPFRDGNILKLDVLPVVRIFAELRALSLKPSLWPGNGADSEPWLLISNQDIESPQSSIRFEQLDRTGDPSWMTLRETLRAMYEGRVESLPNIDSLLVELEDMDWNSPDDTRLGGDTVVYASEPQDEDPAMDQESNMEMPSEANGVRWGESAETQEPEEAKPVQITSPVVCDQLLLAIRAGDNSTALELFDVTELQDASRENTLDDQGRRDLLNWVRKNLSSKAALGLDHAYPKNATGNLHLARRVISLYSVPL